MKPIIGMLLLVLSVFSEASSYHSYDTVHAGWGVEYRFGATDNKVDFFAYSQTTINGLSTQNKYRYHDALKHQNMSCVPDPDSKDGACSAGWVGPMIYILALPVSLYLYKEMFGIE